MRRALQMLLAPAVFFAPAVAWSDGVVSAAFGDPTQRYGHAVLGDDIEYGSLTIVGRPGLGRSTGSLKTSPVWDENEFKITLPLDHVFEDLRPRLVDIDLDGGMEVMVVETDVAKGAQLAIYDGAGDKIAETPHIGRSNRWLAPIGAADFDGDGAEMVLVDAGWSRIVSVRLKNDQLEVRELGQFASDPNLNKTLACRKN